MTQVEKARHFHALHTAGEPLVLYNIWDAGGAKALSDAGTAAIATGSWSLAAAQGYADGEQIPLAFVLQIIRRISATVTLPLTVDFEGGYATEHSELAENIKQLIAAGAVGLNFEDQVIGSTGIHPISDQAARIRTIRQTADDAGLPLFINARTDLFLQSDPSQHPGLVESAIERCAAYAEAGASGFFVPGLTQPALISEVCKAAKLPVNVMIMGDMPPLKELAQLGIARASFGPAPYINALEHLTDAFNAVR